MELQQTVRQQVLDILGQAPATWLDVPPNKPKEEPPPGPSNDWTWEHYKEYWGQLPPLEPPENHAFLILLKHPNVEKEYADAADQVLKAYMKENEPWTSRA